jgi:UDP-glucose 4-epimerase
MTTLILGGCGFIGSHLAEELLAAGEEILVLDRNSDQLPRRLAGVSYVSCEFGNRGALESAFASRRIRKVAHLISSTLPSTSNQDPEFDIRTNVGEAIALLDLCVKYRVEKILFASSGGTVYGIPKRIPIDEDHPTDPISSYGIVKLTIEKYLKLYRRLHGLQYVAVRAANPYGPRQIPTGPQGVVSVFAYRMLHQREIVIWGDGSVVRDYLHVRDLAKLCAVAMRHPAEGIYNVGSGVGISLSQLVQALERTLDRNAEIRYEPARPVDVPRIVLDCSLASRTFNWRPETSLEKGLRDVTNWLQQYDKN